jgi:hypothetical protein
MLIGDPEAGSVSVSVLLFFHSLLEDLLWKRLLFLLDRREGLPGRVVSTSFMHEKVGGDEKMRVR